MCVLSKCLHMLVVDEECFIRIDGHLLHLTYWLFWSSSKCFHTSERLGSSDLPILKERSTLVLLVSSKVKMDMRCLRITRSMLQLGAVVPRCLRSHFHSKQIPRGAGFRSASQTSLRTPASCHVAVTVRQKLQPTDVKQLRSEA